MEHTTVEKEVKFYLSDLPALRNRLLSLGAIQVQPRTRETNYRFDTTDYDLARSGRALRLRHDVHNILTFKGPSSSVEGVRVRPEYEVEVDDLQNAWLILEGLGYELTVSYEKWRAVYRLNNLLITLDELPYGNFSEIEGEKPADIKSTAAVLSLEWEVRIESSYLEMFETLKRNKNLTLRDLTFAVFSTISLTSNDLGVQPADRPVFM